MERTVLYPFDEEMVPVVRHGALLKNIEITGLVSPKGWGYTGRDASSVDGGEEIGLLVESDFPGAMETGDTLLVVSSAKNVDFNRLIFPKVEWAASHHKRILYEREYNLEQRRCIEECCNKNCASITFLCDSHAGSIKGEIKEQLYQITVPVIFVMGTAEHTDKFELQLTLREELLKLGYRVGSVGSRRGCELLEFHSMPSFMMQPTLIESHKIAMFNHYLKQLELQETPEVFIIGVPGGLMPINCKLTNGFGYFAYELSQAVEPDFTIVSSLYEEYQGDYFEKLGQSVKGKYGYEVDFNTLSTKKIDWQETQNSDRLEFLTLDSAFVAKKAAKYRDMGACVISVLEKKTSMTLAQAVVKKLSANACVKSI